jgi:hypothetical protein
MSENITLELVNESVVLTQVISSDVTASADSGQVTIQQILPDPIILEITGGQAITKENITNALGYLPVSPNDAIAYAVAL